MYKEIHWYFNATAFNKLVCDAGYNGIKDFAERSGISISYKTIKRACNDGHCTKRTYFAVANKLAETLSWVDPIASLKKAFTSEPKHEEERFGEFGEKIIQNFNESVCGLTEKKKNYEEIAVCLTNDHVVMVKGKSVYWSWFDDEKTICFYDEDGCDDGDLKIAEFNKACVIGIIRQSKE